MILPGTYANGFAPRDGEPLFPELWRGCVGAWNPGLGPTGLTLRDWSPHKNHGTLTNMPANDGWKVSQGRYALDFDGFNDVVTMTPGVILGTQPFSMCGWARIKTSPTFYRGVFMMGSGFVGNSAYIGWVTTAQVGVNNSWGGGGFGRNYGSGIVDFTGWHHVVLVSSGGSSQTLQLYVDGVLTVSGIETITLTGTHLRIGANPTDAFTDGQIDDVRLYGRALHASEIRLLASRRGIAYEMAPRSWSAQQIAAYRARYYSQVVGGGVI
jgi:hypothetical protein